MPYITDERKERFYKDLEIIADKIDAKGDLTYIVDELLGLCILKGKVGYTEVSNWISSLQDAHDEARRQLLDPYEDLKIRENGDVFSWLKIKDQLKDMGAEV